MQKDRFKLVPAAYLILKKDDEILLLRRSNTGYEDGNYSFIAGHLDGDETFRQAIIREAKEEADIVIEPEDLEIVHTMHRKKETDAERIDFFFLAIKWTGEPKNMEPNKCDELKWFNINDLPSNTIPCIRQVIENFKNKKVYSEFGW